MITHHRTSVLVRLTVSGIAATFALTACGGSGTAKPAAPAVARVVAAATPTVAATSRAAARAGATVSVKAGSSPLGQILVDADGNTLYAFLNDTDAKSTCTGTCADAWPPAIVDAAWSVAPGLDAGVFSTVAHPEGGEQLAAGRYPLYRFSGDARPGEVTGQGSGGVWYVVGTDANPIKGDAAAPVAAAPATTVSSYGDTEAPVAAPVAAAAPLATIAENTLGTIIVNAGGQTVYGFVPDAAGTPTCVDKCAQAWPPVLVEGDSALAGLDGNVFTVVDRPDGSKQLKAGKWPLYTFAGDAAPGDANGQASGGNWFVVAEDGKLIK